MDKEKREDDRDFCENCNSEIKTHITHDGGERV